MSKKILTERISSVPLRLVESVGESANKYKILGVLEGVCADFINPTRNQRRYSEYLWDKVIDSSVFKEMIDTRTLFGELDHPETRIESWGKEAAIVCTNVNKNTDGTLIGRFEILPTNNGRTLKELLDAGCQMGVSSRGGGEIITNIDGDEEVDPETYDFRGWDVVTLPAVANARPNIIESLAKGFKKDLTEEIAKSDKYGLMAMKVMVKDSSLACKQRLIESIDIKLKNIEGDTISSSLENDLEELTSKLERSRSETIKQKEMLQASTTRCDELSKQVENLTTKNKKILDRREKKAKDIKEKLEQVTEDITKNEKETLASNIIFEKEISELSKKVKMTESKLSLYKKKYLTEKKESRKLKEHVDGLCEDLSLSATNSIKLDESVNRLKENLSRKQDSLAKSISECKSSKSMNESLSKRVKDLDLKCKKLEASKLTLESEKEALKESFNKEIKDISTNFKVKLEKLETKLKLVESKNGSVNDEFNRLSKSNKCLMNKYVELSASSQGLKKEEVLKGLNESFTSLDVDKLTESMKKHKDNLKSLPFDVDILSQADKLTGDARISNVIDESTELGRAAKAANLLVK